MKVGALSASATSPHAPFVSPGPAWAEQDPADWWRAAREAVREVLAHQDVAGGRSHRSACPDRCTVPCCSTRADEFCGRRSSGAISARRTSAAGSNEEIGAARLLELTCNPALTNFTLTKLLWVRPHEPEVWARVRHVLLPKDYVRFQLSGAYAIDVADASGTLMLDVARRAWSRSMLDAVGISQDAAAGGVRVAGRVRARVSAEAAAATGLRQGTPIVAGAGDQAAGAVGMGITRPGAVSVTIGTSGVVFAATERPALDRRGRIHTFCHADSRALARDGRHAGRRAVAAMVARSVLPRSGRTATRPTNESPTRRVTVPRWRRRRAVGAVPHGRAHAALRSGRPRGARRPGGQPHARRTSRAPSSKASPSVCATRSGSSPSWTCR